MTALIAQHAVRTLKWHHIGMVLTKDEIAAAVELGGHLLIAVPLYY